jgi:hypothetical protein
MTLRKIAYYEIDNDNPALRRKVTLDLAQFMNKIAEHKGELEPIPALGMHGIPPHIGHPNFHPPFLPQSGRPPIPDTNIVYTGNSIPPRTQKVYTFFVDTAPCWFPECEALRSKYKEELQAMTEQSGGCTDCSKGGLNRKYIALIEQLWKE